MIASRLALATMASFAFVASLPACSSSSGSPSGGSTDDGNSGSSSSTGSDAGASQTGSTGSSSNPGSASDAGGSASSAGSDAGGGGTDSPTDAKIVLDIPASFKGTTRELDVVVTPTVPIAGPPAGILYQVEKPVITAGQPLTVHGDTTGINGKYYVVVVLYMQGGGAFSPMSGVDYEAQTPTTVSFDGGAIDLGTLPLTLVSSDGGT